MASAVPERYNKIQTTAKIMFVINVKVNNKARKLPELMEVSILAPRDGKDIAARTILKILFDTKGDKIKRYTSKLKTVKYGVFASTVSEAINQDTKYATSNQIIVTFVT